MTLKDDMRVLHDVMGRVGKEGRVLRVLDAGCGTGAATVDRFGGTTGVEVLGVDRSPEAIAEARERAARFPYIKFEISELEDLGGVFDIVFCALVLHLAVDQEVFLAHLWDRVAPGGCLVVRGIDDGLLLCWPSSEAYEEILRLTPLAFPEVDRFHGRKMPVQMGKLPGVACLEVSYPSVSTLQGRADFFELTQGWKSSTVMSGGDHGYEDVINVLAQAIDTERERFNSDSDLFASAAMVMACAYRR
jgi:SAM-dependent methyltransferase